MQKAYSKTNWQNLPSKTTALGATNLNKLENGVNTIDDRVIALDVAKADLSTVNTLVKTISFNEATGVFAITLQNGSQTTIDTALEKIAVNFAYNSETQQIELTLIDGTVQYIDVSDFITNVDFETSETIQFLEENGKTKAKILDGSVTDKMLQPNYLADITVQAERGLAYADESQRYAVGGVVPEDVEDNAKYFYEETKNMKNIVESLSDLVVPNFYIDLENGQLMSDTVAKGITFYINENGFFIGEMEVA